MKQEQENKRKINIKPRTQIVGEGEGRIYVSIQSKSIDNNIILTHKS